MDNIEKMADAEAFLKDYLGGTLSFKIRELVCKAMVGFADKALRSQPSAVWVKASERLPETPKDSKTYCCKWEDTGEYFLCKFYSDNTFNIIKQFLPRLLWLDESQSPGELPGVDAVNPDNDNIR